MSTRSQIVVQNDPKTPVVVGTKESKYGDIATVEGAYPHFIYKHCDGYPVGVLPVLAPFAKHFVANRGHDPSYCVAQIIRFFLLSELEHSQKMDLEKKRDNARKDAVPPYLSQVNWEKQERERVTGWGIDDAVHGDIEFLYVVNADGTVETWSGYDESWEKITPKYKGLYETV